MGARVDWVVTIGEWRDFRTMMPKIHHNVM
jgi:hypothetical protein